MLNRELSNKILLMKLVDDLSYYQKGFLRLQVVVFDIQNQIRNIGSTQTFNYDFIRWEYGPYSKELENDLKHLIESGLMVEDNNNILLSDKGKTLLNKNSSNIQKFYYNEGNLHPFMSDTKDTELKQLVLNIYDKYNVKERKMGQKLISSLYKM